MEVKLKILFSKHDLMFLPYNYQFIQVLEETEKIDRPKAINASKYSPIPQIQNKKAIPFAFYKSISRFG
ncbi:MAG: hypothetical protein WD512_15610 [Candidatus Paceibacterota bacterium]